MKLAQLILPERTNNNETLVWEHQQLKRDLVRYWGGYTAVKGIGGWQPEDATIPTTENVWVYSIAMERQDTPKLRTLAAEVAKRAGQQCVMIVTPNGDVEFVKPAVDSVAVAS